MEEKYTPKLPLYISFNYRKGLYTGLLDNKQMKIMTRSRAVAFSR